MRFTLWNPGLNSVGGIPNRTEIFRTLSPSGGEDSDSIQAALDACPDGEVVQLKAGRFVVNNYLLVHTAITLRGAGADSTILEKTNGAVFDVDTPAVDAQPIVIVGPGRWPGSDGTTSQNLTADGEKGSYSVSIANSAGFAAGQFVLLDELSGVSWQTDRFGQGKIWASPDFRVVWQYHNPSLEYVDDPLDSTQPTSGGAASWFCRQDRPTSEIKEVAGISGNTITFTTPLHINYRVSHTAQLARYTAAGNGGNGGVHVSYAGLENFAVTGGSDGAIRFECAAFCWAKNIEVYYWSGEGVAVDNSFGCEVRDSYIHDAAWATPGGGAYAISLSQGSSEILFENNISVRANKVMVARCCGAGSVFGYNYADDGYINYDDNWIEVGLNASHMVGPHHVLFEGNYGFNWDSDFTHGNSIYHTVFRNWLRGARTPFLNPVDGVLINDSLPENGPRRCIGTMAYTQWMTFVGNVLGAPGEMNGWVYEDTVSYLTAAGAIWMLGWGSNQSQDSIAASTDIRDGNWDWLQAKQTWHNSSPVSLQNSLYLKSKPTFFGSRQWPWVDPTTGTVYTLPAKERFDSIDGITGVESRRNPASPAAFELYQNYPNPFNPSTVITYQLPARIMVTLKVYDVLGRQVATLIAGRENAGNYSVTFDASGLSSGVYFYRLQAGSFSQTKKFLLLK